MTVPSFGATLYTWFSATMLAAPGMFSTITLGLPGTYLPSVLAITREVTSKPPPGG